MRTKIIILLSIMLCSIPGMAQNQGIGLHFGGYDFYGPQTGSYFFVSKRNISYKADNATPDTSSKSVLLWHPLVRISYWRKLSSMFDLNFDLSMANLQYPTSSKDSTYIKKRLYDEGETTERFLGELGARINFNIIPREKHKVSPYIFAGLNASYHNVYWGADLPVGIGVNIRMDKSLYLNIESAYKVALTSNDYNHLQNTIGFVYWFKKGYKAPTMAEKLAKLMPPPDMDNDGVPDSLDKCPTIPGSSEFDGCPDTDGDGVPDNMDACPLVAGLSTYQGCPDSDKDGIPDNKDKCPYAAGPADRAGCPLPDSDHDGVPDAEDKCPTVAGTVANHGCPAIEGKVIEKVQKAAKAIYFNSGNAHLKSSSYNSLNQIVNVMTEDPSLYVTIAGYTDNTGSETVNLRLSEKRADACRDYLIRRGVDADRITAIGYGEASPIASNNTAAGRARNRRTEFTLRNYK